MERSQGLPRAKNNVAGLPSSRFAGLRAYDRLAERQGPLRTSRRVCKARNANCPLIWCSVAMLCLLNLLHILSLIVCSKADNQFAWDTTNFSYKREIFMIRNELKLYEPEVGVPIKR